VFAMKRINVVIYICVFIGILFSVGCSPKLLYKHYEGDPLPKNEVGSVMGHDSYRGINKQKYKGRDKRNTVLIITSINDQSIPESLSVELLPGEYKIGGYYVCPLRSWDYYHYFNFPVNVEKGVEYTLGVNPDFENITPDLKNMKASYYYDRSVLSSDPDKSNNSKRIFINQ
jgi:hypothetical protein